VCKVCSSFLKVRFLSLCPLLTSHMPSFAFPLPHALPPVAPAAPVIVGPANRPPLAARARPVPRLLVPCCLRCSKHVWENNGSSCVTQPGRRVCDYCSHNKSKCDEVPEGSINLLNNLFRMAEVLTNTYGIPPDLTSAAAMAQDQALEREQNRYVALVEGRVARQTIGRPQAAAAASQWDQRQKQLLILEGLLDVQRYKSHLPPLDGGVLDEDV
jgi:hypothetical protein